MRVTPMPLPEVLLLEPTVFGDSRGFFQESWNERVFHQSTGVTAHFVQDNHSRSKQHVLRGIHYQLTYPQGKLVRVACGRIFDVAVDLRRSSPRFGQWCGIELSDENHRQLWIPPGFGHGFLVLSESADFLYKTTEYWMPEYERAIAWNDPDLNIQWPLSAAPLVAAKDVQATRWCNAEVFA